MTNPSQQIMRLGLGFAVSQALRVMIELRIPDLLADGARSVDDLATATQSDADALYRVMRLLAPEGVFNEIATCQFKLTEVGVVLRSDHSGPSDFIRMINSEAYLAFEQLLHSVRTGKPAFDKVFGSPKVRLVVEASRAGCIVPACYGRLGPSRQRGGCRSL